MTNFLIRTATAVMFIPGAFMLGIALNSYGITVI